MRLRASFLILFVLLTGACSRAAKPNTTPQKEAWSPAQIWADPPAVKQGAVFHVRSKLVPGGDYQATFTGTAVYLDKLVDGVWRATWVVNRHGRSAPMDDPTAGPIALEADAAAVGDLGPLTLDPAPPPGEYRLRMEIIGPHPTGSQPAPIYWSFATITVLPRS
jgi:hypothetical protein